MRQVGLDESYRSRLPFHLSAGERRRVAIAGVVAMRPNVLLMDEPSSDLDPRGRRELLEILNGLDITRLISSHNLEFVRETCERVILLDGGRVHAGGRAEEILSDAALMLEHGLEVPWSLR
jgi:energy-coupling factor transporter ATP-binding protein EcfA2